MLLWLIVALGFVVCLAAYYYLDGITYSEAFVAFIAFALVFHVHIEKIYDKVTTDHYLVSGYVTSMIYRPAFSYRCGKNKTCHEPERWIIEQRPRYPQKDQVVNRPLGDEALEYCRGECLVRYPVPYRDDFLCCKNDVYSYPISVTSEKFLRTKVGDPSTVLRAYFNPVRVSDEVVYSAEDISYFRVDDFNKARRLIPVQEDAEEKLERMNAEFSSSNISIGLIITEGNLDFERIKRAWHQGKANDFVVFVYAPAGKIQNVNILGWNNYSLKEDVSGAIMSLSDANVHQIIDTIHSTMRKSQPFVPIDFSKYGFLNVKIPEKYYWKIIIFQAALVMYTLFLLHYNPNTKTNKLTWSQVMKMWGGNFDPPQKNWDLHPLTRIGLILHLLIPFLAAKVLWL